MAEPRDEPAREGAPPPEGPTLYSLLVDSVRDYAIFALDPHGHVLTWNVGAQRIKGYTAGEIIGRHFSTFYPPEDLEAGKPAMELRVAAAEGRFEDEGWRIRRDGSRFWANVVITPLRDDAGHLVGFAKVTRDLTERRQAETRAIADASRVAAADAANETKSEFLATLSHELRTPLNAIGGYAELLDVGVVGPLTGEQHDYVRRIRIAQQHLLAVINDLLNYSRVEAGFLTYAEQPVALGRIAARALAMLAPQAAATGIVVDQQATAQEVIAIGDEHKVEQIVLNLLTNAFKFTPAGGRVTVAVASRDGSASLRVTDTGPGIAPPDHAAVFEPFVQVGRSLSSPKQGAGLGLSISRSLARGMHGDLSLESVPGEGATFTLTLPAG